MIDFPLKLFLKLPRWVRDKYLEIAAENAAYHMQGGGKMPVIKEIGFYELPTEVGYVGWIKTADGTYFVDSDGKIKKPKG